MLTERGLVRHEKYGGVELTGEGRATAVEMVRRHRLIETYLVQALDYSWDEVHDEAKVLEHAVSSVLVERMAAHLGDPWRDPHGDPIPTVDGVLHRSPSRPLLELGRGDAAYISRIDDDGPVLLRWFAADEGNRARPGGPSHRAQAVRRAAARHPRRRRGGAGPRRPGPGRAVGDRPATAADSGGGVPVPRLPPRELGLPYSGVGVT